MQTALEAYRTHRIYRGLAEHQLRVASVARYVAMRAKEPLDVELVTKVGLVHDMGNIIKADLPRYQEFLVPEGLAYWESVQQEMKERYGDDEHVATEAICQELGLGEPVLELVRNMRFSRTRWILEEGSLAQKLCKYGDMRVSPWGIVPMLERLAEARERYAGHPMDKGDVYTVEDLERSAQYCVEIEADLMARCDFRPEDVTEAALAPMIEELKNYPLA